MNYKGAFECAKCPRSNDPNAKRACPMWWELMMANLATGEEKLVKACGYTLMPQMMVEVIKSANRATTNSNATRNELVAHRHTMGQANAALITAARQFSAANHARNSGQEPGREVEILSEYVEPDNET